MAKYKKSHIIKGLVTGIESYGIFVSFDEYYSGLIHISEISHGFVKDINDFVKVGDTIYTEILDIDEEQFQFKLSIKNISYKLNGNKHNNYNRKIVETNNGFKTLEFKLSAWIQEKSSKIKVE